jgi:hypothetical protein
VRFDDFVVETVFLVFFTEDLFGLEEDKVFVGFFAGVTVFLALGVGFVAERPAFFGVGALLLLCKWEEPLPADFFGAFLLEDEEVGLVVLEGFFLVGMRN